MIAESLPKINGDLPASAHVVYEMRVACAELQNAAIGGNQGLKIVGDEGLPENGAGRVGREPRAVIAGHAEALGRSHPNKIPVIMRSPTARARQLPVFPPLLSPTRAWNVTGHSTSRLPSSSAVSRKCALNSRLTLGFRCGSRRFRVELRTSL